MNVFTWIYALFLSLWSVLGAFLPIGSIRITAEPAVFDCGDDSYCILWATSTKGSGYVKYTYNGEEKTVWDSSSGIIRTDDTVHRVVVPKAELQNNTYKVGSQYVGFKFGYSADKGRTVESKEYHFNGVPKQDGIKVLCISDIHAMEKQMNESLEYFTDEPDLVVMLGDITSAMETKSTFEKYHIKDAHDLSGGTVPVVYTRGNHETRGEFGGRMLEYFPTETGEFYFTFDFGGLSAVVLDSGEDKEDEHEEYDGLVNFAQYREQEFAWINSLEKSEFDGAEYKLVFSHDPTFEDHFGKDWTAPLKALEMDLLIGGHHHRSEFIEGTLPVFVDGGKLGDKVWAASMLTLENGTIRMLTIDNSGNTLLDKTITA